MPSSPSRTWPRRAAPAGSIRNARAARARAASPSERSPRDPFTKQRVDDDVLGAFLEDQILFDERGERGLDAGWSTEAITGADVRREQALSALQHHGAKDGALSQCQPLPDRLENRLLLGKQSRKRRMQRVECCPSCSHRTSIVPGLVREPLHVVRQVARE